MHRDWQKTNHLTDIWCQTWCSEDNTRVQCQNHLLYLLQRTEFALSAVIARDENYHQDILAVLRLMDKTSGLRRVYRLCSWISCSPSNRSSVFPGHGPSGDLCPWSERILRRNCPAIGQVQSCVQGSVIWGSAWEQDWCSGDDIWARYQGWSIECRESKYNRRRGWNDDFQGIPGNLVELKYHDRVRPQRDWLAYASSTTVGGFDCQNSISQDLHTGQKIAFCLPASKDLAILAFSIRKSKLLSRRYRKSNSLAWSRMKGYILSSNKDSER